MSTQTPGSDACCMWQCCDSSLAFTHIHAMLLCLAGSVLRQHAWPSLAFDPTQTLGSKGLLASAAACCHKMPLFKPCCLFADSMEKLTGQLGETGNQPATRGYRTTEPARIAGEGRLERLCIICLLALHCTAQHQYHSAAWVSRYCSVCCCSCRCSAVTRWGSQLLFLMASVHVQNQKPCMRFNVLGLLLLTPAPAHSQCRCVRDCEPGWAQNVIRI